MQEDHDVQNRYLSGLSELLRAIGGILYRDRWIWLGVVVALLVGEVALRWVRPELAGQVYSAGMTGGHPIFLSKEGFRVTQNGQATGGKTIIALGDSTTFGTGVGAEETWPLVLDKMLGEEVSVRNGGLQGVGLEGFPTLLDNAIQAGKPPAAVVLLVTPNMVSATDFHWGEESINLRARAHRFQLLPHNRLKQKLSELVQSSALWKAVTLNVQYGKFAIGLSDHRVDPRRPISPLMAYGWVQPDLEEDAHERMWQRFQSALKGLQALIYDQGGCFMIGYLPPRFMLSENRLDNLKFVPRERLVEDAENRVQELAGELGIPFVKTSELLRDVRNAKGSFSPPLYVPGDYTHPDAKGHAFVAEGFASAMLPTSDSRQVCSIFRM